MLKKKTFKFLFNFNSKKKKIGKIQNFKLNNNSKFKKVQL